MEFNGTKIALVNGDRTVTLLRDNQKDFEDANKWDLPGGGREGDETPEECGIREVKEELLIDIDPKAIVWKRQYDSGYRPGTKVWFMVAEISDDLAKNMRLGDENQKYELMEIADYLEDPNAVEYCKSRLKEYLNSKAKL